MLFLCHYIAKPPCEQHPSKSYTEPKHVMKNWDQNCDYTKKTLISLMSSVGETRSGNFFLPLHCKAAFCAESYMILLGSRSLPFINLWDQNCDFFYFKHGGGREKRERVLVAVFEPPSRGLPARSRGILTLKTKVII